MQTRRLPGHRRARSWSPSSRVTRGCWLLEHVSSSSSTSAFCRRASILPTTTATARTRSRPLAYPPRPPTRRSSVSTASSRWSCTRIRTRSSPSRMLSASSTSRTRTRSCRTPRRSGAGSTTRTRTTTGCPPTQRPSPTRLPPPSSTPPVLPGSFLPTLTGAMNAGSWRRRGRGWGERRARLCGWAGSTGRRKGTWRRSSAATRFR
mmetsp:Transcript_8523/g.19270  ORF Transcript_8523/g.19270 Transcript_8523/m.19270 type:complete len:206 (+) Transcript_8523:365-982(+)